MEIIGWLSIFIVICAISGFGFLPNLLVSWLIAWILPFPVLQFFARIGILSAMILGSVLCIIGLALAIYGLINREKIAKC
jgi:hypothetical protein